MLHNPLKLLFIVIIAMLFILPIMMFSMNTPSTLKLTAMWLIKISWMVIFGWISSIDQLADIFTKTHPLSCLQDLLSKLQLASTLPPWVWGGMLVSKLVSLAQAIGLGPMYWTCNTHILLVLHTYCAYVLSTLVQYYTHIIYTKYIFG